MAKKKFKAAEWSNLHSLLDSKGESDFGLPGARDNSVIIGTFNIRELGKVSNRSDFAWDFLRKICSRFDLLAIQEVADNLEGINHLKNLLGDKYGMVVSDVTGVFPGERGNAERLAFLFKWERIERTELASDITYDRSRVVNTLFDKRKSFSDDWETHIRALGELEEKERAAIAAGKRKPPKPPIGLSEFVTFIRQPHCASFKVKSKSNQPPIDFLAINAHLLYGTKAQERRVEFEALLDWLCIRAKQADRLYHKNLILLGDCNLEFETMNIKRLEIDNRLKSLNQKVLRSKKAAKANFPLLTPHPTSGELRTNARLEQTYDQIGIFLHDDRLPNSDENDTAGQTGDDNYNYGVFNFTELISGALFTKKYNDLTKTQKDHVIKCSQWEISDHLPAWIRLHVP